MKSDYNSISKRASSNIAKPEAGAGKAMEKVVPGSAASSNARLSSEALILSCGLAQGVFNTKVDTIKAAVASGAFRVDAGTVADGLINSNKGLIRKQK
jgi:flagellar biosynthesis anti-sigma factor FlgM